MASGPITSWQIDGETVETVADFILGGFKITTDVFVCVCVCVCNSGTKYIFLDDFNLSF